MALLEIHTFPDSILRQRTEPVTIFDHELDEIAQSMLETMYFSGGIGLAAIQAGILKKIIVIDLKSGEEDTQLREPHVFINPEILEKSGSTVSEEGCLSVIEFRADSGSICTSSCQEIELNRQTPSEAFRQYWYSSPMVIVSFPLP